MNFRERIQVASRRVSRMSCFLSGVTVFWIALELFGLLPERYFVDGCLVFLVLFYLIAIPLSIVIRLDLLPERLGLSAGHLSLMVSLGICILNLFLLSLLGTYLPKRKLPNDVAE